MAIDRLPPRGASAADSAQGVPAGGAPSPGISEGQGDALQQALRNGPGQPDGNDLAQALHQAGILPEAKDSAEEKKFASAAARAIKAAGVEVGEPITAAQRASLGATLAANHVPVASD